MKTIVVGMDGSEASRMAFHKAIEEAVFRGGEVLAVHGYNYPALTGMEMMSVDIGSFEDSAEQWMKDELEYLERSYEVDFPVPVRTKIHCGHTGAKLIEAAKGAELLVLGSRGYGGFRGLLLGSVTTYCVHHLPCPLLVVPDPDRHIDRDDAALPADALATA